ncbi:MAG: hypothetical protein LUD01_02310 [Clostridiales bacterium]|nr:hypothetical protein [Clostridiales bacterium]
MGDDHLEEIKKKIEKDSYWSKIPLAALRAFHFLFKHPSEKDKNAEDDDTSEKDKNAEDDMGGKA